MNAKRKWIKLAAVLAVLLLCQTFPMVYTSITIAWARSQGVYPTPADGVIANANKWYCDIERIIVPRTLTKSLDDSNPHIRYVTWTVFAKSTAPCDTEKQGEPLHNGTYESGGQYYLNVKDGWIMMPEDLFPEYIGYWMKVLNLAGTDGESRNQR
jgi:hypothetical protein